jgi:hypothetical protein
MIQKILIGLAGGVLFGIMDALINANPLARRLMAAYQPITRTEFNAPAGIAADLVYGVVMAFLFVLLAPALPGQSGPLKGLVFGLIAWFFRVLMSAVSHGLMFKLPAATLAYSLLAGLAEMLIIGLFFGLTLRKNIE